MKVLLPQPDSPTRATDSDGLMVRVRPLKTKSSFLVGYLNHTSMNSILPLTYSGSKLFFSELSSSLIASIGDGISMISKTLSTEAYASPISAPAPAFCPA